MKRPFIRFERDLDQSFWKLCRLQLCRLRWTLGNSIAARAILTLTLLSSTYLSVALAPLESHASESSDQSEVNRYLNPFVGLASIDPDQIVARIENQGHDPYLTNSIFDALSTAAVDLVKYMKLNRINQTGPEIDQTIPRYNRVDMFGSWVNENSKENCYNTRAEALIRDAVDASAIVFSSGNPCQVSKGVWIDPYTGDELKLAKSVQIDHVVPLKNAYRSGAHAWSNERRCHYTNFLQDKEHLLSVSARENMSKGDSGPDEYVPPCKEYVCAYLKNWMRIKAIWQLSFFGSEADEILAVMAENSCDASFSRISAAELTDKRAATNRMNGKCEEASPPMRTREGFRPFRSVAQP